MGNRQYIVQNSDVQWVKSYAMTKKNKTIGNLVQQNKKSAVNACCYGFAKLPFMTNSFSASRCTVVPQVPFSTP
jgi:hypothetical protein